MEPTLEGYLTDLTDQATASIHLIYLRKNNYLTYDGESYKRYYSWKQDSIT